MSCLDNIVSVRNFCEPNEGNSSLSGYDIFDAPELSQAIVSGFIKEDQLKVQDFVKGVMKNQITEISNDFLSVLTSNGYTADITENRYQTTNFNSNSVPAANHERGIVLYKAGNNSKTLKAIRINTLFINSAVNATNVVVKIYDGFEIVNYTLNVISGINPYNIDYVVKSNSCRIVINGAQLSLKSGTLTCMTGCSGTTPNPCGYVKSFNGSEVAGKECFGIGVDFSCFCDFEKLLCNLAKSYTGKLIYYKTRIALLEERKWSDRFNPVVVYKGDAAEKKRSELTSEYNHTWNTLVQGLKEILKGYCGECIKCNGIKYATNGV